MGALTAIGITGGGPLPRLAGAPVDARSIASVLARHSDGTQNLTGDVLVDELIPVNAKKVVDAVERLLSPQRDIAVLYFSGHAVMNAHRTYLITSEYRGEIPGPGCVDFSLITDLVNRSRVRDIVLMLDCCHAGATFDSEQVPFGPGHSLSALRDGVFLIAGAGRDESALEVNGQSIFTQLVLEGLAGGAAELFGEITATSLYAYVDERLDEFDQRPILKANVSRLVPLRRVEPRIKRDVVRTVLARCFVTPDDGYQLTPQHEPSEPEHDPKLVETFQHLKDMRDAGLLKPDARDMYTAALTSKQCRLTERGKHMWIRARDGRI